MIIPYGTMGVSLTLTNNIRDGRMDEIGVPGAPVAIIDNSFVSTLCMNDVNHPFTRPPEATDLRHASSQLAFLENHLVRLCGSFARLQQEFIRWYFAELRNEVAVNEKLIEQKTGGLAGLVEPMHWCFSAPMPLPRAHLALAGSTTAWVKVDCAFYLDGRTVAIVNDNLNRLTGARAKTLQQLEQEGTRLIRLESKLLQSADAGGLTRIFGNGFTPFWDETPLPISPFGGKGIETPLPSAPD